ncbi:hypothetical protein PR048_009479 [Dryococelus australis]|uniref:Uncharacterized protein n=1 Tax=Dryococelus australis TaxID=614101 RepID=A0ABQ9I0Y5_9NEOP|nr:hypothetical protein PR048_009479 [Dryococelus australis]
MILGAGNSIRNTQRSAESHYQLSSLPRRQLRGDSRHSQRNTWLALASVSSRATLLFCLDRLRSKRTSRQKKTNSIRLERAFQKQSSDTHKTPYVRVKRRRERKINIKASEPINVDNGDSLALGVVLRHQQHFGFKQMRSMPDINLMPPGILTIRVVEDWFTFGFSLVGNVEDVAVCRWVFSRFSLFPPPSHSIADPPERLVPATLQDWLFVRVTPRKYVI